jgi:tRNA 2-thiouridine synthesizing protein E
MPVATYAGQSVHVNEEGFFLDSAEWSPEIAEAVAREVGIGALSAEHWKVLSFCREDTATQGQSPGLRRIAAVGGVPIKDLYRLFPKGPGKLAARIAGLPKPKACI